VTNLKNVYELLTKGNGAFTLETCFGRTVVDRSRPHRFLLAHKPFGVRDKVLITLAVLLLICLCVDNAFAQSRGIELEFDQTKIADATEALLVLIEGALGAVIMIAAGIIAIFSAAFGAYRAAMAMLFVAVGSFILRSLVTLFFGEEFEGLNDLLDLNSGGGEFNTGGDFIEVEGSAVNPDSASPDAVDSNIEDS